MVDDEQWIGDREESEADAAVAQTALAEAFVRLEDWASVFENWRVEPGSSLYGDELATPMDPIPHQIRTCIGVALDHLNTFRAVVRDAKVLPMSAGFTILRGAFEAVGTGLWLLGPERRDERVIRSLRLTYESLKDARVAEAEIQGVRPLPRTPDLPALERLQEIQDRRPAIAGQKLSPPAMSMRLSDAAKFVPSPSAVALLPIWRIASGIAHGRRKMMLEILNRRVEGIDGSAARVQWTASYPVITGNYYVAETHLSALLRLTSARSRSAT